MNKTFRFPVEKFIRRFLQHVLPKGFVKVRYQGQPFQGERSQSGAALLERLSSDWFQARCWFAADGGIRLLNGI
jgi:hypothetical protein